RTLNQCNGLTKYYPVTRKDSLHKFRNRSISFPASSSEIGVNTWRLDHTFVDGQSFEFITIFGMFHKSVHLNDKRNEVLDKYTSFGLHNHADWIFIFGESHFL